MPVVAQWSSGLDLSINPTYIADASTRLFEAFDGTAQADTVGAGVSYAAGYLGGQAIAFGDTGARVHYPDSWWAANNEGYQDSGTIELYFRADSFVYTAAKPYAILLSTDERAITPTGGGYPTLAVFENGALSWSVSNGLGGYFEALYSDDPPLYPGQWYHIAATWGGGNLRLYINDTQVATRGSDTVLLARDFTLGASGTNAFARGLAPIGRIDRLRISAGARTAGSFPVALSVRIDSPVGGQSLLKPIPITFRTFASDSRPRVVSIYADTDGLGFDGVLVARDLPDSGTYLLGGGLPDGNYYFYAAARSGTDSAWFQFSSAASVAPSPLYPLLSDPIETTASVAAPVGIVETYMTVLLNGGGTTSPPLTTAANAAGTGANYSLTSRLVDSGDSAAFFVWTTQPASGMLLGLRSDTASITGTLPRGITADPGPLTAFGRTVVFVEFLDAAGRLLGDTRTTTRVADTFVYTIQYRFSKATTALLRSLGFDTGAGSNSFAFFYADTIGAAWIEDTTVAVSVSAGTLPGGMNVTVSGITRDLPGGLGASSLLSSSTASVARSGSGCVLAESGLPPGWLGALRELRDAALECAWGRFLASLYYALCG